MNRFCGNHLPTERGKTAVERRPATSSDNIAEVDIKHGTRSCRAFCTAPALLCRLTSCFTKESHFLRTRSKITSCCESSLCMGHLLFCGLQNAGTIVILSYNVRASPTASLAHHCRCCSDSSSDRYPVVAHERLYLAGKRQRGKNSESRRSALLAPYRCDLDWVSRTATSKKQPWTGFSRFDALVITVWCHLLD